MARANYFSGTMGGKVADLLNDAMSDDTLVTLRLHGSEEMVLHGLADVSLFDDGLVVQTADGLFAVPFSALVSIRFASKSAE
jgi:hypothetical protein